MEATEHWEGHDVLPLGRALCGDRGLLPEPLVRARGVVVADVLGDDALEVAAVQHENVVEALAPQRPEGVLAVIATAAAAFTCWTPLFTSNRCVYLWIAVPCTVAVGSALWSRVLGAEERSRQIVDQARRRALFTLKVVHALAPLDDQNPGTLATALLSSAIETAERALG